MGSVRLASLTLEGFKSFAARVELSFPGAIIAIVGPNGSGKSNISDSIAWVLGEQSARLLRSQNMADVIFAGAPSRPALGAAEVTLTLASPDGRWSETDGRLAVARRVMRDGTSEYRMQGRRVRLKDVMDELMDAGLGTRAYAIIEQGRIGQVLSVKATERRSLFEEAAGITKFRARRHEAELKLAETSANLLRLADVAAEVRRALEQARRQARRAEKHRELRTALAEVRAALFAGRRAVLLAAVEARQQALTTAGLAEAEAAATLASADAALAALRRDLDGGQERLTAARDQEARSDALSQRREAEEEAARRETAEAFARREAAVVEADRLAAAARALAQQGSALAGALAAAEGTLTGHERQAKDAAVAAETTEAAARTAGAAGRGGAPDPAHRCRRGFRGEEPVAPARGRARAGRLPEHAPRRGARAALRPPRPGRDRRAGGRGQGERRRRGGKHARDRAPGVAGPAGGAGRASVRADRRARPRRARALAGAPRARRPGAPARRGARAAGRPGACAAGGEAPRNRG